MTAKLGSVTTRILVCAIALSGAAWLTACGNDDSATKDKVEVLEQLTALSRATQQGVTKREFPIDESETPKQGDPHTTKEVIDTFRQGDVPLAVALEFPTADFLEPDFEFSWDGPDPADEYGPFKLVVTKSQAALEALLSDQRGQPLQEEDGGVRWEIGEYGVWLARKPFENVLLFWTNAEKQTDERWDRLGGILEQLP